jgi:hypothetical protein
MGNGLNMSFEKIENNDSRIEKLSVKLIISRA